MRRTHPRTLALVLPFLLAACGDAGGGTDGGTPDDAGADAGETALAACTDPTAVPCEDELYQQLDLKTQLAQGLVTDALEGGDHVAEIDARAGGAFSVTDAFTYARFTDDGLVKVEIDDDEALTSMDWDIAFRRFIIRLNGGDSGPSCVAAVRLPGTPAFDEVTAVPANASWHMDDFFTESCGFIDDGSGLPTAPATVLGGYYTYQSCLQMSGNVYVVRLASGRLLKLTVEAYYAPLSAQAYCEQNAELSPTGTSAVFTVRWAFLEE